MALPRSHLPHQPIPHSGVRGILRAPSPAGSFLGGFRTPATGVCRAAVAGRHPKPSTKPALSNRSKTATYSITSSAARNGETRRLSDLEVDDQHYFRSVLTRTLKVS